MKTPKNAKWKYWLTVYRRKRLKDKDNYLSSRFDKTRIKKFLRSNQMTNFTDNILKILANYTTPEDRDLFHDTIDELCSKGIGKACYQDYGVSTDVLNILTECQCYLNVVCQKV